VGRDIIEMKYTKNLTVDAAVKLLEDRIKFKFYATYQILNHLKELEKKG
jgi:hypothetical protein